MINEKREKFKRQHRTWQTKCTPKNDTKNKVGIKSWIEGKVINKLPISKIKFTNLWELGGFTLVSTVGPVSSANKAATNVFGNCFVSQSISGSVSMFDGNGISGRASPCFLSCGYA